MGRGKASSAAISNPLRARREIANAAWYEDGTIPRGLVLDPEGAVAHRAWYRDGGLHRELELLASHADASSS